MKKTALALALAAAALPSHAGVVAAPTPSHEGLEQFADLTQNARAAASLENANQNLSRGFDVAAAAPAAAPANGTPTPAGLEQAPPQQGIHYAEVPPMKPDVDPPDTKAEDEAKKKNLQRAMIGGVGGGFVLAVFGFIFGGPIGALALGAVGFAAFAGITHMNNNPI